MTTKMTDEDEDTIKPAQVVLFDPGLGFASGHWTQYNLRLSNEFGRRGIPVTIYGCRRQEKDMLEGLPVEPLFNEVAWHAFSPELEENFELQRRAIARDLAVIDRSRFGPDTLLEFASLYPGIFAGYLDWLAGFPDEHAPKAAFIFQFPEGTDVFSSNRRYIDLFRRALPANGGYNRLPSVRFFAGSESLAQRNSVIIGMPVKPLPMMAYHGQLELLSSSEGTIGLEPFAGVRIGYFGHASLEKGAQFLEEIVQHAQRKLPNVQFVLHLNYNPDTETILRHLHARRYPNVKSYWGHLSETEITALRGAVDAVFLPYNRKYLAAPSMVFTECMVEGKPTIIPDQSSMSYAAYQEDGPVVRFQDYTVESMFAAISEAVSKIKQLKQIAARTAPVWRARHNITNFVGEILKKEEWSAKPRHDFGWSALQHRSS
jgi:hypothetical protein